MNEELTPKDIEFIKILKKIEFNLQKNNFRIDSTEEEPFKLITNNYCGITIKKDGQIIINANTSFSETVGRKIGIDDKIPAKRIYAENGNIVLDAKNGDIVLRGDNIQIVAKDPYGGQIILDSSKLIQMNSSVQRTQTDIFTVAASLNAEIAGGYVSSFGNVINEHSAGTDEEKASFFGKILSAIKKFKKFFDSKCK